jgi:hypothetical protein
MFALCAVLYLQVAWTMLYKQVLLQEVRRDEAQCGHEATAEQTLQLARATLRRYICFCGNMNCQRN